MARLLARYKALKAEFSKYFELSGKVSLPPFFLNLTSILKFKSGNLVFLYFVVDVIIVVIIIQVYYPKPHPSSRSLNIIFLN